MIRFLLFFLSSFSTFAITQNEAEVFALEGNKLFGKKDFSEAIQFYEQALQYHPSAQIFFNIGESYYALQKPGLALAYFLKAKKINPHWKLLNETLHSLYQQYPHLKNKSLSWYYILFCSFHKETWSILITLFICLTICFIIYYQLFSHKKTILFITLGNLFIACFCIILFILNIPFKNMYICPETTSVLFAPTDNSPIRYNLLSGTQCMVKATRSDYFFINTFDHRDGWIKKESLISL